MKKLLLILLCLPLIFNSCQDNNPSPTNSSSNLDSDLFGTWLFEDDYEYIIFNSNATFQWWNYGLVGTVLDDTITGSWNSSNSKLVFSGLPEFYRTMILMGDSTSSQINNTDISSPYLFDANKTTLTFWDNDFVKQ